jgi:hypothetical protein
MQQGAVELAPFSIASLTASERVHSLTAGTAAEIFKQIETVFYVLMQFGIPTRPYSLQSVETLLSLNDERQLRILTALRRWTEVIASKEFTQQRALDFLTEVRMVEKAISQLDFKLEDHSWLASKEEQIIEVYNLEAVQLYRSLSFFKTCGYSLLDLCIHEWYNLWERPQKILQDMNRNLESLLSGIKKDSDPGIAPHLVLETFNDGATQPFLPRAVFVNFTGLYPLYRDSGHIGGFVLTSTAKVVSEGEESLKINFI